MDHPPAKTIITNVFAEVFSNKTVSLYYFYSNDESLPRAFHTYQNAPGWPKVVIGVRENQHPLDEFIALLFEVLNSKGEKMFMKLAEDAKDGTISKTNFAKEIVRVEFEAAKGTRDLLVTLKLSKNEKSKSKYYSLFIKTPSDFEEFLSYTKGVSPKRDLIKEYELKYDLLRSTP